ncbi:HTH domain-containing protein [Actinoplanes sp. NPDC023801]|uniref:HTH domain-containing protein n=1 Tax=Actinoplanes sp. NPDC023801 TaxID=3154595 RepID=UPI0033E698AB
MLHGAGDGRHRITARRTQWASRCSQRWRWWPSPRRIRRGCEAARDESDEGRLCGTRFPLSPRHEPHSVALHAADEHTGSQLAELLEVSRSTVYRAVAGTDSSPRP